ncbi:hypothetical protein MS3_00011151 [Schistosoma haematobium]|uniref:Uncharacterized protein n=1 Tax=Schistosoma haematobium TaxID=6185 RepID=A0A922LF65_SCHHA|nr:hypothetical protein MS3_00011151 [Schistosoma haematobium]KAH9580800.1 hypothetical protein MS3_00011151 [Schistosoma haematobium]
MYWMYIILLFIIALFNINKQIEAGTKTHTTVVVLKDGESGKANSSGSPTDPTKSGENNSTEVKPSAGGPSNEKDGSGPGHMNPSTNSTDENDKEKNDNGSPSTSESPPDEKKNNSNDHKGGKSPEIPVKNNVSASPKSTPVEQSTSANNNNNNNNHNHTIFTNGNLFISYPHLLSHNTINESLPDFSNTAQQQQTFSLHSSTVSGVNRKPSNIDFITDGHLLPWRNSFMERNKKGTLTAISALTLVPNTLSSDRQQIMNSIPWLRTNSTSHNSSNNGFPSAFNHITNHINKNNDHSRFGASSATILFSSLNPPNGMPRSWWLPWRRSMRKKRRLYTHLQRRQEIQSLSQRGLL